MKKILLLAALAHTVNAAYCAALGDASQPPWEEAPQWQKDSIVLGVELHLEKPDAGPQASHEAWLKTKAEEGWAFGEVKDVEKKLHPCFVSFDQLSEAQRAKDFIFRAVVLAGAVLYDALGELPEPIVDTFTKVMVKTHVEGKTPVKYVGVREVYTDGLFGTQIMFRRGETKLVADDIAHKMFKHPSVYEPGEAAEAVEVPVPAAATKSDHSEEDLQNLRDQVAAMDKTSVIAYAQNHYRMEFSKHATLDSLRSKLVGLIDQYGVAQ